MKKTKKMSARTAVLLAAALLLLTVGTYTGVRAELQYTSNVYRAHFYLNHLQVHLLENGRDVCDRSNTLDGSAKVTGALATESSGIGYKSDLKTGAVELGSVEPGKVYEEVIQAENRQDVSEFVRMTIRKYWVETKDGEVVMTDSASGKKVPKKTTELSPDQIMLMYNGSEECNPAWAEVKKEQTDESKTYVYTSLLKGNGTKTEPIFNQLKIDKSLAALKEVREEPDPRNNGGKIYTYIYQYDGYAFFIEAEVQAIQTHNVQDAVRSQWGPYIEATYSEENDSGTLRPLN